MDYYIHEEHVPRFTRGAKNGPVFSENSVSDRFRRPMRGGSRPGQKSGGTDGRRIQALHVVTVDAEADRGWEKGATIQLNKIVNERLDGKVDL